MQLDIDDIANKLKALGHPVRLKIVKGLVKDGCNVNKIVKGLGLPQSTVSQHLAILKNAGIIKGVRSGVKICYKVADEFTRTVLKEV
jgi:ArsR family transcriptional regulator, arsenate/arsenite/antimonite-responsive transcriptional repressor